jgi:hypothetical protein
VPPLSLRRPILSTDTLQMAGYKFLYPVCHNNQTYHLYQCEACHAVVAVDKTKGEWSTSFQGRAWEIYQHDEWHYTIQLRDTEE